MEAHRCKVRGYLSVSSEGVLIFYVVHCAVHMELNEVC